MRKTVGFFVAAAIVLTLSAAGEAWAKTAVSPRG